MADQKQDAPATLTEIVNGAPVPFVVDGVSFAIRQPEPEEYDDAQSLYDLWYAKAMSDPRMAELKNQPCSDGERESLESLANLAEEAAKQPGVKPEKAKELLGQAQRLHKSAATRTYAEELAHDKALRSRDRWLTIRLLLDGQGNQVFDEAAPDFKAKWAAPGMLKVKEAARRAIWRALDLVENAPFVSATSPGPSTG
jgi:hypothetical protein